MELGMIGPGRMGTSMVKRLLRGDRVLSALRYQFGGHEEKAAASKAGG